MTAIFFSILIIFALLLAWLGCYLVKTIPEKLIVEYKADQEELAAYSLPKLYSYHSYSFYLLSIIVFVLMAIKFDGNNLRLVIACVFSWFAILLAIIDWRTRLITDNIVYPFLWFGLVVNSFNIFCSPIQAIYGAIAGYLFLWGFNFFVGLFAKKQVVGNGDMKMMAALGAWFGLMNFLNMFLYFGVFSFVCLILYKVCLSEEKEVPFAIVLAVSSLVFLLKL